MPSADKIMNTTDEEKKATKDLVDMCRVYLLDNFHKFKEDNKIKIALKLIEKSMPTQLEGSLNVTMMGRVEKNGKPLEVDIG